MDYQRIGIYLNSQDWFNDNCVGVSENFFFRGKEYSEIERCGGARECTLEVLRRSRLVKQSIKSQPGLTREIGLVAAYLYVLFKRIDT